MRRLQTIKMLLQPAHAHMPGRNGGPAGWAHQTTEGGVAGHLALAAGEVAVWPCGPVGLLG
jgi:hypothetical protein